MNPDDETNTVPLVKKSKLVAFICAFCGKTFFEYGCQRNRDAAFCSMHCRSAHRHKMRSVTLPCSWCGEPVTKPISFIRTSGLIFCNKTHSGAYRKGRPRNTLPKAADKPLPQDVAIKLPLGLSQFFSERVGNQTANISAEVIRILEDHKTRVTAERKTKRSKCPPTETLREMYATQTDREIADAFGVHRATVSQWLGAAGIQTRKGPASKKIGQTCFVCGDPVLVVGVNGSGSNGRCTKCATYFRVHGSERPPGYKNPRYRDCPWTKTKLYELYWVELHGTDYIAALVDPPVTPKVIRRWMREFDIPARQNAEANKVTALRYGASNAAMWRTKLIEARLRGLVTSNGRHLHTPEVHAKVAAANRARAKRQPKARSVSRSYLDILQEMDAKQREKALGGKGGFNRLRALSKR